MHVDWSNHRAIERSSERAIERSSERAIERSSDRATERSREREIGRSRDRGNQTERHTPKCVFWENTHLNIIIRVHFGNACTMTIIPACTWLTVVTTPSTGSLVTSSPTNGWAKCWHRRSSRVFVTLVCLCREGTPLHRFVFLESLFWILCFNYSITTSSGRGIDFTNFVGEQLSHSSVSTLSC